MGAQDKLVPAAGVIANNLYGTKFSTKSTFRMTPKVKNMFANPQIDAVNFLGSIHAKQIKIADNNAIWNGILENTPPLYISNKVLSQYTTVKGQHDEVLPGFAATTIEEWNELQTAISRAYNIININGLSNLIYGAEALESQVQIGLQNLNVVLTNAIGGLIGFYAVGAPYAEAWNSLKVPADAALGFDTPFIAPVLPQKTGVVDAWYRYTGKSRWAFPFTGWDLTT